VGRDPTVERDFREFVGNRSGALQRTAYLLTGDWSTAEDLVRTTLMKTYLAWRRAGGLAAAEVYARKVMVNAAASRWRRHRRGERPAWQLLDTVSVEGAEWLLERDAIWAVIRSLPAGQRAVVVLRCYENLTEAQTAALLGVSPGTVKRQASRAMHALRQRLSGPSVPLLQAVQR
jgi:RNA polymerase sigma-70 factor (sigma-E family)